LDARHMPPDPLGPVATRKDRVRSRDGTRAAATRAEGRAMTLEQAVAYALDEQPSA